MRIVGAVLRNERSVLTVSSLLNGAYGLHDVCLSVPCIVDAGGCEQIAAGRLTDDEASALRRSAEVLRQTLAALDTASGGATTGDPKGRL